MHKEAQSMFVRKGNQNPFPEKLPQREPARVGWTPPDDGCLTGPARWQERPKPEDSGCKDVADL